MVCLQTSLDDVEAASETLILTVLSCQQFQGEMHCSYGYVKMALRLPATPPARSVCKISIVYEGFDELMGCVNSGTRSGLL